MVDTEIDFQLRIWRYAITRDACEKSAVIAEDEHTDAIVPEAWDHKLVWLQRQKVAYGDEEYHQPPEHWCLPGVTELRIIRNRAFWDLVDRAR